MDFVSPSNQQICAFCLGSRDHCYLKLSLRSVCWWLSLCCCLIAVCVLSSSFASVLKTVPLSFCSLTDELIHLFHPELVTLFGEAMEPQRVAGALLEEVYQRGSLWEFMALTHFALSACVCGWRCVFSNVFSCFGCLMPYGPPPLLWILSSQNSKTKANLLLPKLLFGDGILS